MMPQDLWDIHDFSLYRVDTKSDVDKSRVTSWRAHGHGIAKEA